MKSPFSRQKVGLAVLVVSLVVVAATMAILLYLTLQSVPPRAADPRRPGMVGLAWVSLFALAVVLLLLLWAMIRAIAIHLRPRRHERTEYVDAWALAGKRLDAPKAGQLDQDDEPDDEGEDEGEDDGSDGAGGGDDKFTPPGGRS